MPWLGALLLALAWVPSSFGAGASPAGTAEELIRAVMAADFGQVRQCVSNGAPVNATLGPGVSAWHAAKIRGREDIASFLVSNGAVTNVPFPASDRLLEWACPQGLKANGPGFAIAVVQEGQKVFTGGWGLANLDYGVPIAPDTVFHVASVSKQFTAFATELLETEGKLSIDDEARKYVPRLPAFSRPITLRHLLNHTSGVRDQWDLWVLSGRRMEDVITQDDLLRLIEHQQDLNFLPGEEHLYSNSGFTLLAEAVAKVSGHSFCDFTRDRIFEPMKMAHTHFHLDQAEIVTNMAYSYAPEKEGFHKCLLNYGNVGATSLYTTANDLALWILNLDNPKVGNAEMIGRLCQKAKLNNGHEIDYGLGLAIGKYRGTRAVEHGGADAGYRSYVLWLPDHHWGVAVVANLSSLNTSEIAYRAADAYLHSRLAAVNAPQDTALAASAPTHPETWDAYVGTYRLGPNWLLTITREGDRLMAQAIRESKFSTTARSDTNFWVEAYHAAIEFPRPDNGPVKELLYKGIHAPRVQVAKPAASELAAYAGDYWSEELRVLCSLEIRDGRLMTTYPEGSWQGLNPTEKDVFYADAGPAVAFVRDGEGKISGLKLSTGRIRDLRFTRVSFRPAK